MTLSSSVFRLSMCTGVFLALFAGMAQAEEAEIKLELPQPVYGGTPLNYWGENLEPPSFKPRPPIMAPEGTSNVSAEQPVTASSEPNFGKLSYITDGNKEADEAAVVELKPGHQWVQIDLGKEHDIYAIVMWHFHSAERVYFDVAVQVSSDPEFKEGVETVYNNDHDNSSGLGAGKDKEYIESYKGRVVRIPEGVNGRYVRLYSNGNTTDKANHYIEVEVYGIPAGE